MPRKSDMSTIVIGDSTNDVDETCVAETTELSEREDSNKTPRIATRLKFRKDSMQELILLRALALHQPFRAPHGQHTWDRLQEEQKKYEAYIKSATGISPDETERRRLLEELCEGKQAADDAILEEDMNQSRIPALPQQKQRDLLALQVELMKEGMRERKERAARKLELEKRRLEIKEEYNRKRLKMDQERELRQAEAEERRYRETLQVLKQSTLTSQVLAEVLKKVQESNSLQSSNRCNKCEDWLKKLLLESGG
ncbi:hypothetical protein BCR41DRAFT_422291 [Lobosporangium transversale]|uniref:Uncharacterized protein n=1 Tax=Lobosporangium transversale TaxID=64571 RepID=A0A1Y2GNT3_9FUNG|nr:hypothetical protein BCR41DRAFT_422291 [Lobosporangium transversale]ORZ15514.1 hypothetical protein BCR41DRAFT_422291 [Lobosporangium transversale]|eukprot:XP_021881262.1 hypothetical protein BCR41DRAFT_422291 [Lobosporangium transversale]